MSKSKRMAMSADLLRQRRNLLIVSLALLAVYYTGASFKDEIGAFGSVIKVKHPERMIQGAWVFWAYFLLRYWQYLTDEIKLGIRVQMEGWLLDKFADPNLRDGMTYYTWSWRYLVFWEVTIKRDMDPINKKPPTLRKISLPVKILATTRAFIHVSLTTPKFTDYLLPYCVAALPVIAAAIKYFNS